MTTATEAQQKRLRELHEDPDVWVGYWCSDQWGRSANGGSHDERWHAAPGKVQEIDDGLEIACCPSEGQGGLHATRFPHRWSGCRVWVVGLSGEVVEGEDKKAARRREIVCEIRPCDVLDAQIAARVELVEFDMSGADLRRANLWGADLGGADLWAADLRDANLRGADLRGADLWGTDLRGADLWGADLWGASLYRANLRDANLRDANLRDANLRGADLRRANLRDADLTQDQIDQALTSPYTQGDGR